MTNDDFDRESILQGYGDELDQRHKGRDEYQGHDFDDRNERGNHNMQPNGPPKRRSLCIKPVVQGNNCEINVVVLDKECHTIADAVGNRECMSQYWGSRQKEDYHQSCGVNGHRRTHEWKKITIAICRHYKDRIAKLEQGHGSRETKRATTGRCYGCSSPDHFMRNCPHKTTKELGNFQATKDKISL
ncbi:unnamed protein product [Mytilus edulis]|uniref:CCHC-type domain-containing protein n=1 Tax=Mytilus edulis TaxID=6550 RepID=A0A8S3U0N2_MYTED|nr:unnamed protein product [Mytilus edulis]